MCCPDASPETSLSSLDAATLAAELVRDQLALQLVEQLLLAFQLQLELLLLVEHFEGSRLVGYLLAKILHHVRPGVSARPYDCGAGRGSRRALPHAGLIAVLRLP